MQAECTARANNASHRTPIGHITSYTTSYTDHLGRGHDHFSIVLYHSSGDTTALHMCADSQEILRSESQLAVHFPQRIFASAEKLPRRGAHGSANAHGYANICADSRERLRSGSQMAVHFPQRIFCRRKDSLWVASDANTLVHKSDACA